MTARAATPQRAFHQRLAMQAPNRSVSPWKLPRKKLLLEKAVGWSY
jgi:hypothetical protein